MTYLTTGMVDAGVDDFSVESAICKVYGSETCWRVVNDALQIAAGIGYMADYPYERSCGTRASTSSSRGPTRSAAFIPSRHAGPRQELAEVARAMREPIKGFAS